MRPICLLVVASLLTFSADLGAQAALEPRDVGALVNAVLDSLLPPGKLLSRTPIDERRRIRFDAAATFAAFVPGRAPQTVASLGITRDVLPGTAALLADCDFSGRKPCALLGDDVLVTLRPATERASVDGQMVIWLEVRWVTEIAVEGGALRRLSPWYAVETFIGRSPDGGWRVVATGVYMTV